VAVVPSFAPVVPRVASVWVSNLPAGFKPAFRLLQPREYTEVFENRRVLRSSYFALHYRLTVALQRPMSTARLGLVIPKKNARDAVLRNAVKRQVREVFRRQRAQMLPCDLVLRLAQPIDRPDYQLDKASKAVWRQEIEGLFDKLKQTLAAKTT
jgi:ribonuclease P protein component